MATSIIAVLLVLGGLIFFHELGHFLVARIQGIGVKTFSLGWGPKLVGFKRGLTEYRISIIPIGGFVSLAGENLDEDEENGDFPDSTLFKLRPAWQRMLVVAAGPVFNLVLAWLIYWVLIVSQGQTAMLPTVGKVMPESPALTAGFQTGDRIVRSDGAAIEYWGDLVDAIQKNTGQVMHFEVQRGEETLKIDVQPKISMRKNIFGEEKRVPMIGIQVAGETVTLPLEGIGALAALEQTWTVTKLTVQGFVKIIERVIPLDTLGGPILIAQIVGESAHSGLADILALAALISINLAIINLLPIPVLDGGHILYFGLEMILRRPISERWRNVATRIGIAFLLMLMSLAIYNDLQRIFS